MNLRLQLMIDYYAGGMLHVLLKPLVLLMGKLLRRNHDLKRCSTVTIVKMLGGGSLVIAYPALLAIKNAPHVKKLQLLTTPAVQPFAATLAIFDSIILVRTDSPVRLVLDSVRAIRLLFLCDAIVDLEVHSRLTTVFSVISCARNRIGFYTRNSFWRRQLATHLLFCNLTAGIYHYYDQIAALFGGKLPHAAECRERFRAAIGAPALPEPSSVPRIALSPCCSDLSKERMLRPEEWVVALRRRLSRDGEAPLATEIHLFGAPRDRASLDELGNLLRRELPRITPVNHAGQTSLLESVRQMARLDELLCIDSALLHFGRLLGMPTTSFWGPTDPQTLLRPWPGIREEIHYQKLPCSPCVHLADDAPCRGNNICMRLAVDPDRAEDRNPAWVVADESVTRFTRVSGP